MARSLIILHDEHRFRYFLDTDLLDRVPSLFLLLAGVFAALEIPGMLLLREPTEEELKEINAMVKEEEEKTRIKAEEVGHGVKVWK